MWRYLKAAFWAKPEIPGFRRLPINALAVGLVGVAGLVQPWFWIAGGVVEFLYLGLLVSSSRFRRIVDVIDRRRPKTQEVRRKHWIETLSVSDRHRLAELIEKGERVMNLFAASLPVDALEEQRQTLDRFEDAYLRLLVAHRGLEREDPNKQIRESRRKLDRLGRELELLSLSEEKRQAKERQRTSLAESLSAAEQRQKLGLSIRADLEKIETEVALAVDRAARHEPASLTTGLDFETPIFGGAEVTEVAEGSGSQGTGFDFPASTDLSTPSDPLQDSHSNALPNPSKTEEQR